MKRALLSLFLVCVLIIAGCTSTTPTLRDVYLQNMNPETSEGKNVIKLSVDYSLGELEEEVGEYEEYVDLVLNVLESGIVLDYKQSGLNAAQYKLGFVDPDPIKELPFWNSDVDPYVEFIVEEDGNFFMHLSSEDYWITEPLSDFEIELMEESNVLTEMLVEVVLEELTKFVAQFEFDQLSIEDHGLTKVDTPNGEVDVKHFSIELSLDDVVAFVATILENLIQYEGLEDSFKNIVQIVFQAQQDLGYLVEEDYADYEAELEAEIDFAIEELKMIASEFLPLLKEFDSAAIVELLGVELDFNIQTDLFVTPEALIVGNVTTYDLYVADPVTDTFIDLTLTTESDVWNVNGEVEIVAPEDAITIEQLLELAMLGELSDGSVFAPFFAVERIGELTIGSDIFLVTEGNDYMGSWSDTILLDAPPYVTAGGHTMVPVSSINDIAGTVAEWNNETKEATFAIGGQEVVVQSGSHIAHVNGVAIEMPEEVVIVNNRTFVPLRFVSENLGATVIWNEQLKTIHITF